eukprot:g917.t1
MKLYAMPVSQPARAVMWACLANDLKYDLVMTMPGGKGENGTKNPKYIAKFPMATIPSLEDGDVYISESHAIMCHLAEKHGWDMYPSDPAKRAKINEYLHWHHRNTREITLALFAPLVRRDLKFSPGQIAASRKMVTKVLNAIEGRLRASRYLCGDTATLADLSAYCEIGQCQDKFCALIDFSPYPNISRWMRDCEKIKVHQSLRTHSVTNHMDFHLATRVRSEKARNSLKKLKRPRSKHGDPSWSPDNKDASERKRVETKVSSKKDDDEDAPETEKKKAGRRLVFFPDHEEDQCDEETSDRTMLVRGDSGKEVNPKWFDDDNRRNASNKTKTPSAKRNRQRKNSKGDRTPSISLKRLSSSSSSDSFVGRSFWSYVLDDFDWSNVRTDESVHMNEQRSLLNFQKIPYAVESLQIFGIFVCLDTLMYTFTVVPIRVLIACVRLSLTFLLAPFRYSERKEGGGLGISRRHVYDIFRGILLCTACSLLYFVRMSLVYHYLRSQSGIKLYVLFGILDIFDRLCTSIGQDCIEALHSATMIRNTRRCTLAINFIVALLYVLVHSMLKFVQLVTLNVAMNSKSNAVLTLVISSNFAEMKSLVFKRFDESNVFQISCADIVERFVLLVFLVLVLIQNWAQSHMPFVDYFFDASFRHQMWVASQIWGCEVAVDWIKHAFVSKFNKISYKSYNKFKLIIGEDIVSSRTRWTAANSNVDTTHAVTQRLGLATFPLTCLIVRICGSHLHLVTGAFDTTGCLIILMIFLCLFASRVLSNQLIALYCVDSAQRRGNPVKFGKLAKINRYTLHKNRIP